MTSLITLYILLCLYLAKNVPAKPNNLSCDHVQLLQQNKDAKAQIQRQDDYFFMVKIRIGTFERMKPPSMEYFLHVDTSSPLTWLQCQGCKRCFRQEEGDFPKNSSKSFRAVLSSEKICSTKPGNSKFCPYNIRYDEKSYTSGILAREKFFLYSPKLKKYVKFENTVFGCGMVQNRMVYGKLANNKIAGALGLGRGPNSLLSQIESVAGGKFSHCFPSPSTKKMCKRCKSRLLFGAEAGSPRPNQMMTELHQIEGSPFYYLELEGISVNDQRLAIDASVFRVENNKGGGGVVMNSGVALSQLIRPAYDVFEKGMDSAFEKLKATKGANIQRRPCYTWKPGKAKKYYGVPTATYHFKGNADLVIKGDALFTVFSYYPDRATICLGIFPNDKVTVIGANQQVDHSFTFDTKNNQLSFHPDNC